MAELIHIAVAYAEPDRQMLLELTVPVGLNLREAVLHSGIAQHFPTLDMQQVALGIWGRQIAQPEHYQLQGGERIELYRPLIADPKEVRKQRAAKAKLAREAR